MPKTSTARSAQGCRSSTLQASTSTLHVTLVLPPLPRTACSLDRGLVLVSSISSVPQVAVSPIAGFTFCEALPVVGYPVPIWSYTTGLQRARALPFTTWAGERKFQPQFGETIGVHLVQVFLSREHLISPFPAALIRVALKQK